MFLRLLVLGVASIIAPVVGTSAEPLGEFRIVAYVPNWIDLHDFSQSIRYDRLTHINVAFENPINDQGEMSFNTQNVALLKAARQHSVKVLVSIGGGSAANDRILQPRYRELLGPEKRAMFAQRLLAYVSLHGFDGLDVDLEGPAIDEHYGPFIEELARLLRPEDKLLTAALSQGYGGKSVPDATLSQFDFVNIMAYDGTGPWGPNRPGQHSSIEFAKSNVDYWLSRGLKRSQAVLGVPFYGYGFGEDFSRSGFSYKSILANYPGAEKTDEVGNTIWFNGMATIRAKTQYAVDSNLGGIMIWSLNQDVDDDRSLLRVIAETSTVPH